MKEDRAFTLASSQENRKLLQQEDTCDKYDYIASVACGAIGGMIDIFLVGAPGDSVLGNWTDTQVNNAVMAFSRKMGWSPKAGNAENVNSAIGFLEQNFKVNYDQRKPGDVENLFNIAPGTHHMMSLAHSPDIVGLFFSVLNQFTSTSSFIANGQLITIRTDTYELQGGNFIMKIVSGIANWFGHIMSDIAGSSGSHGRGTGIAMPFYELFGLCTFGKFKTDAGTKDLSEVAMQAFTKGFDFRFGLTQAIPLLVTELTIRLIWAIRRRFQKNMPLKECIPTERHSDLRVMLLIGNGTLCLIDGIDAATRSGGNAVAFFLRLNLVAWFRFAIQVLKEVFIRVGIADALHMQLDAFRRINEALQYYLEELEKIDFAKFQKETEEYSRCLNIFAFAKNESELNRLLLDAYESSGMLLPWHGYSDFDRFMDDPNSRLVFE